MSRNTGRRPARSIALAAAALTVVVGAAPAGAAFKIDKMRFKVKLTATQTTTWSVDRRDPFETCGLTFKGSGTETMKFKTKRLANVFVMQAYDTSKPREQQPLTFMGDRWQQSIRTAGTVNRQGTMTTTPNSDTPCADGDGDGGPPPAPPAPDCGLRRFDAYLGLTYYPAGTWPDDPAPLTGVLALEGPSPGLPDYENCPGSPGNRLLLAPNASLKVKTVIGKVRKFSVRGSEREVYDNDGSHHVTTMSWKATFTRIKTGKMPTPGPLDGVCQDSEDNDSDDRTDDQDPDCYRTNGTSED